MSCTLVAIKALEGTGMDIAADRALLEKVVSIFQRTFPNMLLLAGVAECTGQNLAGVKVRKTALLKIHSNVMPIIMSSRREFLNLELLTLGICPKSAEVGEALCIPLVVALS